MSVEEAIRLLEKAVEMIRIWHGIGMPSDQKEKAWQIYLRESPEMQEITQALAALKSAEAKTIKVSQCSGDICPFKIMVENALFCKISKLNLTSTVFPLPEHCPLHRGQIIVSAKSSKPAPCELCGDSGVIKYTIDVWGDEDLPMGKLCPRCQPAPSGQEAGEFTKRIRKEFPWPEMVEHDVQVVGGKLYEALSHIDRLELMLDVEKRTNNELCKDIDRLEADCSCVKALCDSMDEFGKPMKDTQWTELGEHIYEIVAEQVAEVKRLKEALRVIAGDTLPSGYIYTSDKAKDKAHQQVLVQWLNENTDRDYTIIGGAFYGLVTDVAAQALGGQKGRE